MYIYNASIYINLLSKFEFSDRASFEMYICSRCNLTLRSCCPQGKFSGFVFCNKKFTLNIIGAIRLPNYSQTCKVVGERQMIRDLFFNILFTVKICMRVVISIYDFNATLVLKIVIGVAVAIPAIVIKHNC